MNRFGNEGTGVQTYRRGNYWTPGTYVQFITNCRPETTSYTTVENGKTVVHEQHNMLVSTWFNALDGKGWQYMATVRKRNSSTYFSSWYSFLENYVWANGQASRKAYYRNGYGRSRATGKRYNFNSVGFGHSERKEIYCKVTLHKQLYSEKIYHIFQHPYNWLYVKMIKAGRWLADKP